MIGKLKAMIGKLKGIIDEVCESSVIVEVAGVGYVVNIAPSVSRDILVGEKISFFIEQVVTEHSHKLYGYRTKADLEVAKLLAKVSGVSYRIASNLVGFLGVQNILSAINSRKPELLKITGVGKKLAERIVAELSQVVSKFDFTVPSAPNASSILLDEAIIVLENLGYSRTEVASIVRDIVLKSETEVDLQSLVKEALKELA